MENGLQGGRKQQEDTPSFIKEHRENRLLFSGALGVSIVAFTGLLQFSLKEMDAALIGSLVCLIGAIPINAMSVYLTTFAIQRPTNLYFRRTFLTIAITGLFATLGGLIGLFWHISCVAGVSFSVISLAVAAFALFERSRHSRT